MSSCTHGINRQSLGVCVCVWSTGGHSEWQMRLRPRALPLAAAAGWSLAVAEGRGQHGLAWLSVLSDLDEADFSVSQPP